ncbi:extensin [Iris pallida]|uniref:Extensin n=1 Tax=Iris pallida TaxID=29817 RepID=A0AAX6IBR5_IRIPA|nr:extensin [Iris pallida]
MAVATLPRRGGAGRLASGETRSAHAVHGTGGEGRRDGIWNYGGSLELVVVAAFWWRLWPGSADSATTPTVQVDFGFWFFSSSLDLGCDDDGVVCWWCGRRMGGWRRTWGSQADCRRSGEKAVVAADVWVAGVLVGAGDATGQRQQRSGRLRL